MIQEPITKWMRKSEEQRWMGNAFRFLCWFCYAVSYTKSNTNIWCLEWGKTTDLILIEVRLAEETLSDSVHGWIKHDSSDLKSQLKDEQTPWHVCASYVLWMSRHLDIRLLPYVLWMEKRKSETRSIRAISLCSWTAILLWLSHK